MKWITQVKRSTSRRDRRQGYPMTFAEGNQYILVSVRDITHERQQIGVSTSTGVKKEVQPYSHHLPGL